MNHLLLVALGGAIGASMRYGTNLMMITWFGKAFPYGTLTVNIIGSMIMGVLFSAIEHGIISNDQWRMFIGVGLLGAFTTFSTFSLDTLSMLQQGAWEKALLNIFLNVSICLLAAYIGMQLFSLKQN